VRATAAEWDEAIAIPCPYCRQPAGSRCVVLGWGRQPAGRPHRRRVKLAFAVRAHADPALDEHWPHHGPCLICGVEGLGARHRRIDAVAGHLAAGEEPETVTDELDVAPEAVAVVAAWMERWPGAWL